MKWVRNGVWYGIAVWEYDIPYHILQKWDFFSL